MNKQEYQQYLQSRHWKIISEETKRLAGYRCQVCNSNEDLHAHHRTYDRLGDELQSDLTCLCGNCHALFHGKVETPKEVYSVEDFLYDDNPIPYLTVTPKPELEPVEDRGSYHIIISLHPSGDDTRDKRGKKNVLGILSSSHGKDTFALKVYELRSENFEVIEFPGEHTHISEEMLTRVSRLIGSQDWEIISAPEGVLP